MKFKKFIIPALCMAMLSAGCSGQDPVTPGNGQNGNGGTNENIENGLQVTASTTVINAGFSYLKNRTRIQLSYGRNRAGYVCSGGACRYMPAYTGLNLVITSSF